MGMTHDVGRQCLFSQNLDLKNIEYFLVNKKLINLNLNQTLLP